MATASTISTQKPADIAYDYQALRKIGIDYLEKIASKIWTDYNIHDPGITSLEILCYAITDLGYRSSYKVPDLMLQLNDTPAAIMGEFHTAKKIFPGRALTMNDYRKLIIDIEGVKNAWLNKRTKKIKADLVNKKLLPEAAAVAKSKDVQVKGYYDVLLEFDTDVRTPELEKQKIDEVKKLLQENRNLDEDFVDVDKVPRQSFRLCSEIEVKPGVDINTVLANIYFNIQLYLSPVVKFYNLQQMLDAGFTADVIFEGPYIKHGFIKESELLDSELRKKIRLSDLMQIILNTEGVISIPDIIFNDVAEDKPLDNKWIIDVKNGFQPIVDILDSNVVIYKDGIPFRVKNAVVNTKFEELMSAYLSANEKTTSSDISFYTGSFRNLKDYHSIQNHFPKTYGISHWGLPEDASVERKKQAKQLQGYLWLFDQALANYLAQLSSVKNLFSWKEQKHTYFTQLAKSFNDPELIFDKYTKVLDIGGDIVEEASWKTPVENIQKAAEDNALFDRRRNRFLDHLLSRFAESFYDYASMLESFDLVGSSDNIIQTKQVFLEDYPAHSGNRALAYNYTDTTGIWDTTNTSGYEKRVQRLLGFKNINRRSLVNMVSVIRQEGSGATTKFWFEVIDKREGVALLIGAEKFDSPSRAEEELNVALTLAAIADSFKIVKDDSNGKFQYELRDKLNKLIATGRKGTKTNAEADLKKLFILFAGMCEEGMFLVEHLLVFDETLKDTMPICVDQNCDECSDTDPYSFRVSIVMPAYAPRFLQMDFRRYTEKVMREEMPSHLMPKICWINNEQLSEFEDAYHEWLEVKAGVMPDADGAILRKFINILTRLKSVYPEGHLLDCSGEAKKQLFMLDKNSLGTQKTS
jgi:hypothetical protein